MSDNGFVIDTPEGIARYQHIARYHALKLECMGMRRSGRAVSVIVREVYGLKAKNKAKLLAEYKEWLAAHGITVR